MRDRAHEALRLARELIAAGIAPPAQVEQAIADPVTFLGTVLDTWTDLHDGGDSLYLNAEVELYRESTRGAHAWSICIGAPFDSPTLLDFAASLELLRQYHPRLPATVHEAIRCSIGKWIPVYSWDDAVSAHEADMERWREMSREDREGCTRPRKIRPPASLLEKPLQPDDAAAVVRHLPAGARPRIIVEKAIRLQALADAADPMSKAELDAVYDLANHSFTWYSLAITTGLHASPVQSLEEEMNHAMQIGLPSPTALYAFASDDLASIARAFTELGLFCKVLYAADDLIHELPKNNVTREEADT